MCYLSPHLPPLHFLFQSFKECVKKTQGTFPKLVYSFFPPISFCPFPSAAAGGPAGLTVPLTVPSSPAPHPSPSHPHHREPAAGSGLRDWGGLKPSPTSTHSGMSPWEGMGGGFRSKAKWQGDGEEEGGIPCSAIIWDIKCSTRDTYLSSSCPPDCVWAQECAALQSCPAPNWRLYPKRANATSFAPSSGPSQWA